MNELKRTTFQTFLSTADDTHIQATKYTNTHTLTIDTVIVIKGSTHQVNVAGLRPIKNFMPVFSLFALD